MTTRCILCCRSVATVKTQTSALDQRLFHCLCKTFKTHGPNNFRTPLTENPVCCSCFGLLKTADDTLIKLEELELKIAKIAEDLKCTLKLGYSALKESWQLPGQEFEYVPTDVQKFLLKAVGVDTDEDYIEVVPLSHDEFKRYEEVYEEDAFSPLDTGVCNEDRDDDIEGVETENSEQSIQHQESQVPERERSSERISGCGDINKLESPIKELALRKRKRKCDEDLISNSIEGAEILSESVMEADTSEVCNKRREGIGGGKLADSEQQQKKPVFYCFYNGCRKGYQSIKTLRAHMVQPHDVGIVDTDMEFNCKKCEQSFPTYVDILSHLTSEHAAESNSRFASLFCQKCGKDFTSVRALGTHMRDHPRKRRQYRCHCFYEGCREICESIPTLRAHVLRPHDGEIVNTDVEFNCNNCKQLFPTYIDMFNHVTSQHDAETNPRLVPLFCQKCGNDFTSVKALKSHVKGHSSTTWRRQAKRTECRCFYYGCHEICGNINTLRAHVLRPHDVEIVNQNVEFSCDKCNQSFPTYVAMFSHLSSDHEAENNPRSVKLLCQKCGQTYLTVNRLKRHVMMSHRGAVPSLFSCNSCGKYFIKENFLRRHEPVCRKIKGTGLRSCRICRTEFFSWWPYRRHMIGFNHCTLTKHNERRKFVCRGCGKPFLKRSLLEKHYKVCRYQRQRGKLCPYSECSKSFKGEMMLGVHLHEPHQVKLPEDDNGKRPYFCCYVCKMLFLSYGILAEHIKQDHPTESPHSPLPCQLCGKYYKNIRLLRDHMKFHVDNFFICETCGKTYRSNEVLLSHLRKSSCGSKRRGGSHVCKGCSKSFKYETGLQKHQKAGCPVETKGPEDLRCKLCFKEYPTYDAFKTHEYNHKRKDKITCEVCQRKFESKAVLIRHRRSHFPEEKLSCHLCPRKYSSERHLRNHVSLKHFGKGNHKCPHCDYTCVEKLQMESHVRKHTGEKPFMCDICGMTFRSQQLLKMHRKIHMDRPHKCGTCGHAFLHRFKYERHMRTHTNPQLHWKVRQKLAREAAKKAQHDSSST